MRYVKTTILFISVVLFFSEGKVMADTSNKTQTRCIGRYLIDIPIMLKQIEQTGLIETIEVSRLGPGDKQKLEQYVDDRKRALEQEPTTENGTKEVLREVRRDSAGLTLSIGNEFPELDYISPDWIEESYILSEDEIFKLRGFIEAKFEQRDTGNMRKLATIIRPREATVIPNKKGTCLPQAFAELPVGNESYSASFVDQDKGPFVLNISIVTRTHNSRPLPPQKPFDHPNAKDVTLAGLTGSRLRVNNNVMQEFAMRLRGSMMPERVEVDIRIKLTDQRALEGHDMMPSAHFDDLWEQIVASLRRKE